MTLEFSALDKALGQLGQSITANNQGERSHLSQLAELQAKLDALKIDARAKAGALRAERQSPITITIEIGTQPATAQTEQSFQAEVETARQALSEKAQRYRAQLKDG